jgi:hypothetical protein
MKTIPGDIESLRRSGAGENSKNVLDGIHQIGTQLAAVAALVEFL